MRVTFSGQSPLTPLQGEDSGARAPSLEGRVEEGLRGLGRGSEAQRAGDWLRGLGRGAFFFFIPYFLVN